MVLFICSGIYPTCCFSPGAFGLSGFTGSLRFGTSFNGLFSSVSLIKYLRLWWGQGNSREIATELHKLTGFTNPPFLISKHAEQPQQEPGLISRLKIPVFSLIFMEFWMILSNYTISQKHCRSQELERPWQQILLFLFRFGLCIFGGRYWRKRSSLETGNGCKERNERNRHWWLKNVVCNCCL